MVHEQQPYLKGTARNRPSRQNEGVARTGYTRLYATVSGALLVLTGLAGMLENAEFSTPELWSKLLGFYAVNGWANAVHIGLGLLALLLAPALSRLWAAIATVIFLGLGIWGVLAANSELLFGVLPAERSVNLINLALGGLALLALVASRWDRITNVAGIWERRMRDRRVARKRKRQLKLKRKRVKASRSAPSRSGSSKTSS